MADLIDRQVALDTIMGQPPEPHYPAWYAAQIEKLPAVQPDHNADVSKKVSISCSQENDLISRREALNAITDELMPSTPLSAVIRAKNRLKDLPSVQPDHVADIGKKVCVDTISRQAALKKLAVYIHLIDKTMGKGLLTDDDCMEAAKSVLGEDELPAVQPEIIRCKNCKYMIDTGDDLMCDNAKGWVVATTSDFGCVLAERRTE